MNTAVTLRAALIVTVQAPVPVQEPRQPAKYEPSAALGTSVTGVSAGIEYLQIAPQSIPPGDELTLPMPVPVRVTDKGSGVRANVAPTLRA
ncbi:MAG: hypothetical protein OEM00_09820 [Burkholderiaceae bacterium]|nr:hypothetical protein [Burkholderiaceae bacterium]